MGYNFGNMNGYCKDDGDQLFFLNTKDQTAGGELKLKQEGFMLVRRKNFTACQKVKFYLQLLK